MSNEKWYWPTIVDLPGAIAASNKGVWAAGIVAAITFIVATMSLLLGQAVGGFDPWSYIDAVLFGLIAWGTYRRSRICAVTGLVLFIIEKAFQLVAFGLGILGLGVAGFFVVLFVIGVKGTFAFHRLRSAQRI
ncbi:MAG TPA: hypothetical protein VJ781_04065 [Pyrinomonadaceae bacterium]|jgi:hypothetical protein|nr:hypothetical protein [Pyrinomonadaceae bacterium]